MGCHKNGISFVRTENMEALKLSVRHIECSKGHTSKVQWCTWMMMMKTYTVETLDERSNTILWPRYQQELDQRLIICTCNGLQYCCGLLNYYCLNQVSVNHYIHAMLFDGNDF